MAIYSYLRVSTVDQAQSGAGLDAQRAAINKYLTGRTVDREFCDGGYSGKTLDRPALMTMLEALKAGDIVIVGKMDRLSRDMYMGLWIEKEILRRKAELKSCEGSNGKSASDELQRNIMRAFAQFERHVIAERTRAALAVKKASGVSLGHVPYGWRAEGEKKARRLFPVESEQAVLAQIRKWRKCNLNSAKICKLLNSQGIPSQMGNPWNPNTLRKILNKMEKQGKKE